MKFSTACAIMGAIFSEHVAEARRASLTLQSTSYEYAICKFLDGSGGAKLMQGTSGGTLYPIQAKAYIETGATADQDIDFELWNERECAGLVKGTWDARAMNVDHTSGIFVHSRIDGGITLPEIWNIFSLGIVADGAQVACCNIYSLDYKEDPVIDDRTIAAYKDLFNKLD